MRFFTSPKSDVHFDKAMRVGEKGYGDDGKALFGFGFLEFAELSFVKKHFSTPCGSMVVDTPFLVVADVHTSDPELVVLEETKGIFEVHFAHTYGFDFRALQHKTRGVRV